MRFGAEVRRRSGFLFKGDHKDRVQRSRVLVRLKRIVQDQFLRLNLKIKVKVKFTG